MENKESNTAAEIICELSKKQVSDVSVQVLDRSNSRNQRHFAVIPTGVDVTPLHFLDAKMPSSNHRFIDGESFEKYLKAYSNPKESRLFASLNDLEIDGVIDYQPVNPKLLPSEAVDGSHQHVVSFRLIETEDFKAWKGINGQFMTQADFVEFLQERSHCVEVPDQATILEVARNLEIRSDVTFSSKERRSDGGFDLIYREDIETKVGTSAKVKVPESLVLKLHAFEGGESMELKARLYFKMSGGKVVFAVKILNLRETVLKTFRGICNKISESVGLDVHYCE